MNRNYRATAHVGPFTQGDEVIFDDDNPVHAGLIRSGWFEVIGPVPDTTDAALTALSPLVEQGTIPLTITVTGMTDPEPQEAPDGGNEDPGGVEPDVRAQRRRQSRSALRRGNYPAGAEPSTGAVPEEDIQPG